MKNYLVLLIGLVVLNLLGSMAGCSSCDDPADSDEVGYFLAINIIGLSESFKGRRIEIDGNPMEEIMNYSKDQMIIRSNFCTDSEDRFLNAPVVIAVYEDDTVVSETLVERIACKYSDMKEAKDYALVNEEVTVFLNPDGTVDARFGDSEDAFATCWLRGYSMACMNSILF